MDRHRAECMQLPGGLFSASTRHNENPRAPDEASLHRPSESIVRMGRGEVETRDVMQGEWHDADVEQSQTTSAALLVFVRSQPKKERQ